MSYLSSYTGTQIDSAIAVATAISTYSTGTFTATATGMTTSPTGSVSYTKTGNNVTLNFPNISGTSNSNNFSLTGLPSALQPATAKFVVIRATDNGISKLAMAYINPSGTIYLYNNFDGAGSSWYNGGIKEILITSVSYTLV